MNNKEFEDFFKDLDKNTADFFEDSTTGKAATISEEKVNHKASADSDFFENESTMPDFEESEKVTLPEEEPVINAAEAYEDELDSEDLKPKTEKKAAKKHVVAKSSKKNSKTAPSKKSKVNTLYNWMITVIWVASVLCISIIISIFALRSINDLVGFNKESYEAEVTIPEGASLRDIASILKKEGIIDEPFSFEVYARLKKKQDKLDSGTFTLNSNLGYDQIFLSLKKPIVYEVETVTITFFEGMTASEIGKKLEENKVCSYDDFMKVVDTGDFDYEFAQLLGTSDKIFHKWEGYLFPDTYEFYVDDKAENVVGKFLSNFNNKFSEAYYQRLEELEMGFDRAITLASIIQSEANSKEDMYKVSSVFHNRLQPGSGFDNLQSDVTYFYYRDEIEPFVTDQNLSDQYHTSYDTYYVKGIPVGPICCPGIDAIDAALNPDESELYYFVTDKEGNFYYAKTLAQHEQNIIAAGRTGGRPEGD